MGCDVHMWLEHREADDAKWQIQRRSPCECQSGRGADFEKCFWCGKATETNGGEGLVPSGHKAEKGWRVMRQATEDYDGHTGIADGDCYHTRNYALFNLLAGVRADDDFKPVFEARGVPEDASTEYASLAADDDGHSHSWLDLNEVEAAFSCAFDMTQRKEAREYAENTRLFWRHVVELQMRPIAARVGPHNVRIVFYFDN